MKIKTAFLDKDLEYLHRITVYFQQNYSEKVEVYAFSEEKSFEEFIKNNSCHVILCDTAFSIPKEDNLSDAVLVYFVDASTSDVYQEKKVIAKYQKVSQIYKELLNIAAENMNSVVFQNGGNATQMVVFTAPQGGSGASTIANAYALQKVKENKKVFYLNLEKISNTSLYFKGEGTLTLSDVLFDIKSKKNNVMIKMESAIRVDQSGVEFFKECKNPNDRLEVSMEDLEILLRNIYNIKEYDFIVVDIETTLDQEFQTVITKYANEIILISDGTEGSNQKLVKLTEILQVWEQQFNNDIIGRSKIIYNRFSSSNGMQIKGLPIETVGGVQKIEGADQKQISYRISEMEFLRGM